MALSKFKITEWIKGQSISPLKWGGSASELITVFKNSQKELDLSIKTKTPFISLDFVEFYFEDGTNYQGVSDIVIKCGSIYKGRRLSYFDKDWLRNDLSYEETLKKLSELNIIFKIYYVKYCDLPVIVTSTGQSFVFDDVDLSLANIYIKKGNLAYMWLGDRRAEGITWDSSSVLTAVGAHEQK